MEILSVRFLLLPCQQFLVLTLQYKFSEKPFKAADPAALVFSELPVFYFFYHTRIEQGGRITQVLHFTFGNLS